jgi:hypothetical protein
MERRLKKERKYASALARAIWQWEKKINEWDLVLRIDVIIHANKIENSEKFKSDIDDYIVKTLKTKYEQQLQENKTNLAQIEKHIIDNAILFIPEARLLSFIEVWEKQYPAAVVKTELKQFVEDRQNVHTRVISNQTDKSLKIIDATVVLPGQKTIGEIVMAWMDSGIQWQDIDPVYKDMEHWGKESFIYADDDYLYRKTLRSLWALIKSYNGKGDIYNELVKRLWEECHDSVEMCGQGHITRLANVMVGFHEGFLTPKSTKEDFQDKMANIAANGNISVKEKTEQAIILMNSINMPEEEREAWLDAF